MTCKEMTQCILCETENLVYSTPSTTDITEQIHKY